MSEQLVRAQHLSRTFSTGSQEILAVRDASCTVGRNARIALFGPSGSGKSTLLQLLGGLDQPTSGKVEWPALSGAESLRPRHIAFVFQNETLLPALSALENVEIPLLLQGMSDREARRIATEALERLRLGDLSAKLPEELSGGQAQRVAFARALAGRPDLVLADEPTGQLDQATADQLFTAVLPWMDEMQTAMIVATHDRSVGTRMQGTWAMEHGVLAAA